MANYRFYLGGYTSGGGGNSLHLLEYSEERQELSVLQSFDGGESPSFFAIRGGVIYASNELSDKGCISAIRAGDVADPEFLGSVEIAGKHACHVALTPDGRFVYTADYSSANIFGCAVNSDGTLGQVCANIQHEGKSVNPNRQEKAHAHSVNPDPLGRFLIACDLGMDKLMNYAIDPVTGALSSNPAQPFVETKPGEGPRHMVFHPNGRFAYVVTELGNSLIVYDYDDSSGVMTEKAMVPLLDEDFTEADTAADVHMTADGARLYASVRGKNVIAAFHVNADGMPGWIGTYPTYGDSPRNFCLTADERYIIVAHQMSGDVTVCPVDAATGAVGEKLSGIVVPGASCVLPAGMH